MALDRHSTSAQRTSAHSHPYTGNGSRASLPPPLAHSLPPPVLGLRSYQITDHSYEEKDLEVP